MEKKCCTSGRCICREKSRIVNVSGTLEIKSSKTFKLDEQGNLYVIDPFPRRYYIDKDGYLIVEE